MSSPAQHHEVCAQCPACGLHELVAVRLQHRSDGTWRQIDAGGLLRRSKPIEGEPHVQIDTCPVCFGAWFDSGELDVLAGDLRGIEDVLDPSARPTRRPCPHGHGPMLEHALAGVIRTPVDRCPTCGGVWLDGDERRKLARATTSEGQGTKTERLVKRGAIWVAQLLTQVPVEVDNPARGTPYIVLALIVALVVLFVGQQLGYVDTYAYAVVPGRLRAHGDWETLLSYMVLHGSWVHLAGNAYFLYTFGDNIEHLFGRLRFPTFLVACAVVGALAHSLFAIYVTRKTATPLVGISGSISGVLAAYLWAFPRQRLFQVILWIQIKIPVWVYLFVWIGFHLLMGFFGVGESAESVAWFAHLGGFLTGLVLTPWYLAIRRREVAARVRVPALGG